MPRTEIQSLSFRARPVRQQSLKFRLLRAVTDAMTRRHDRKVLARLDFHLLRDIGLSPDDARTECAKPFWQE